MAKLQQEQAGARTEQGAQRLDRQRTACMQPPPLPWPRGCPHVFATVARAGVPQSCPPAAEGVSQASRGEPGCRGLTAVPGRRVEQASQGMKSLCRSARLPESGRTRDISTKWGERFANSGRGIHREPVAPLMFLQAGKEWMRPELSGDFKGRESTLPMEQLCEGLTSLSVASA